MSGRQLLNLCPVRSGDNIEITPPDKGLATSCPNFRGVFKDAEIAAQFGKAVCGNCEYVKRIKLTLPNEILGDLLAALDGSKQNINTFIADAIHFYIVHNLESDDFINRVIGNATNKQAPSSLEQNNADPKYSNTITVEKENFDAVHIISQSLGLQMHEAMLEIIKYWLYQKSS